MKLVKLEIELIRWGEGAGTYKGQARFDGDAGSVALNLNPHHIEEIFRTCADSIIETSKAAARHLTMSIIEHKELAHDHPAK